MKLLIPVVFAAIFVSALWAGSNQPESMIQSDAIERTLSRHLQRRQFHTLQVVTRTVYIRCINNTNQSKRKRISMVA